VSQVIDAHQHFIDPTRTDYPWLTADLEAIARRFGPEDLAPELSMAGIDRTILVQTLSSIEETRSFLATAAATPYIAGVVGWVDLTGAGVGASIERLRAGPGGDRLVGIRHQVHDEPDPAWLLRPDVRHGLAAVAGAGLAYDVLVRVREMPAALIAARERSDLRLVIDHLAKPPIRSGDLRAWATRLRPFGELDHVWCKLSGLVTEAEATSWRAADLAPAVEIALDVFGPSRLIFGSDWPVCLLASTYQDVVSTTRVLTAGLTEPERASVFGVAAERAYALPIATERIR
jgi:L-fuconolactonase